MYDCAHCGAMGCMKEERGTLPPVCPMRDPARIEACLDRYREEERDFFRAAAAVEADGYCQWPRLREVGEFSRRMGYKRVGIAFCMGLRREARVTADTLRRFGLEVASAGCKTGGIEKTAVGIAESDYVRPGTYEVICNPIAQAELLREAGTEFNVVVGLCVGHDSLFFKYSHVPATTLIAKDRVLANNPAGAIYCAEGYLKEKIEP